MSLFKSKAPDSQFLFDTTLPELEHCAIALSLDMDTRQEHIIIGELEHINIHLSGINRPSTRLLFDEVRPFGTMIEELFCSRPEDAANTALGLLPDYKKSNPPFFIQCVEALEDMFASNNMIWRFIALRMWQEYRHTLGKSRTDEVSNVFQEIVLPLRFSHRAALETLQDFPNTSLYGVLGLNYFKFPAYTLYKAGSPLTTYQASDLSVLPLFVHYLNTVYTKEEYFQYCKRCGKIYPAKTSKIKGFCSDECRKAQTKENKKRYDDKIHGDKVEAAYKNCYMYWYNRVKKMDENSNIDWNKKEQIFRAMEEFCKEGKKRKSQVRHGAVAFDVFQAWLYQQQARIDELLIDM